MEATREQLDLAADEIRALIDMKWDTLVDLEGKDFADKATREAYDAVTLLHEHAKKGA